MSELHKYMLPVSPKSLRESINVTTSILARQEDDNQFVRRALKHLTLLGAECDRKRPVGSDGKHGDRHTPECGCFENPLDRWCCTRCRGKGFENPGAHDGELCVNCDGRGWTLGWQTTLARRSN